MQLGCIIVRVGFFGGAAKQLVHLVLAPLVQGTKGSLQRLCLAW